MNFFSRMRNAATIGLEVLKVTSIPIKLSNEVMNRVASNAFGDESEIKSVTLNMKNGWFEAVAHINHNLAEFDVTVAFEIVRFEVSKQVQVIELLQKGELQTVAQGWRNCISLCVIKSIILAFLGRNLLQWGLKNTDGVNFIDNMISVDLVELGTKDAIFSAIAERIGKYSSLLLPFTQGGADKLADYVSIIGDRMCRGCASHQVSVAWFAGAR